VGAHTSPGLDCQNSSGPAPKRDDDRESGGDSILSSGDEIAVRVAGTRPLDNQTLDAKVKQASPLGGLLGVPLASRHDARVAIDEGRRLAIQDQAVNRLRYVFAFLERWPSEHGQIFMRGQVADDEDIGN